MGQRICTVPGCEKPRRGSTYCRMHDARLRRRGSLDAGPWHRREPCSVDGCSGPDVQGGMCAKHHARTRRHGDAGVVLGGRFEKREAHPNWAGDSVLYGAAHTRIRRLKGLASDHRCVDCGGPAEQWSYNHRDPSELLDGTLRYSTDAAFYEPRCVSCHRIFDLNYEPD